MVDESARAYPRDMPQEMASIHGGMTATESALPAPNTLLLLGAGGYVGGELSRIFYRRAGWRVVGVFHRMPTFAACDEVVVRDIFTSDLADLLPPRGRVVLLNAAFDFRAIGTGAPESKYQFLEAVVRILAERPGSTCINISSMSAFPGCETAYGREKLVVENLFSRHRGINIRPGLITSWQRPGSAFLTLLRVVQRNLVVPYLTGRNDGFFICDLQPLLDGIDAIVGMALNKPHTLSFCYSRRMRLRDVLHAIRRRTSLWRVFVPVPWRLAFLLVLTREWLCGKGKIRADSIRDFGFPAIHAPRRYFFARIIRQRYFARHATGPANQSTDDFFFLEEARYGGVAANTPTSPSRDLPPAADS